MDGNYVWGTAKKWLWTTELKSFVKCVINKHKKKCSFFFEKKKKKKKSGSGVIIIYLATLGITRGLLAKCFVKRTQ